MISKFSIKGRKVSNDERPLIIVEIGINHNGSLKKAKQLVDKAHKSGAEIIKHQTHIADDEMSEEAKKAAAEAAAAARPRCRWSHRR